MDFDSGLSELARERARSDGAVLSSVKNARNPNEEIKVTFLDNPNNANTTSPLLADTEVCLSKFGLFFILCLFCYVLLLLII